jgi:heat shock protein HslJ
MAKWVPMAGWLMSTATETGLVTAATVPDESIEAVVVEWPVYGDDAWYVVVELQGTEIDGETLMVLEFSGEIVCGPEARPISPDQLEPGSEVTFQRGHADTQPPPFGEDTRGWPASQPISAEAVHTSCPQGTEEFAETLARYRGIWDAAGIDSYDFTLQIVTMMLDGTYQISVVDGTPRSVERLEGDLGPDVDLLEIAELPKTIDAVFDQLERELTSDDFAAEFDDELGYPTHVLVDRIADAVDDELEFYITDFTVTSTTTAGGSIPASSVAETTELELALDGREFVSSQIEGHELVEGSEIRLTFGDWLGASGGCNFLDFNWSLDGDRLVIGDSAGTAMACEPATLMDQDDWLASFLTAGPTVAVGGDTLTLTGDSATITLIDDEIAEPDRQLEGTPWELTDLINAPAVAFLPGTPAPTLSFNGEEVAIDTGCNTGGATYEAGDGTLTIGPIRLTRMACTTPDASAREATVLAVLEGTTTYEIEGDVVTITKGDTGLIYRATDAED